MSNLDELYELKKRVAKKQAEAHKAAGALDLAMKDLKKDFDCDSKEEALELLKVWNKRCLSSSKKFSKSLEQFKTKYPELFEGKEQ